MKRVTVKLLSILIVLWGGFILYNSSQGNEESNSRSRNIVDKIKEDIPRSDSIKDNINNKGQLEDKLNLIIRKSAHFMQYFIFSILVIVTLEQFNIKNMEKIIYCLFIVLLFATCDEYYQSFIDGRTSSVMDILIDFFGGITGVILHKLIIFIKNKFRFKKYFSIN